MNRICFRVALALTALGLMILVPIGRSTKATSSPPYGGGLWQSNCTMYTLDPTSQSFGASGGTGSVNVDTGPGGGSCVWNAQPTVDWITIDRSDQVGDQAISYSVAANPGVARTGTIEIHARPGRNVVQTLPVSQLGTITRVTLCSSDVPKITPSSFADCGAEVQGPQVSTLTVDRDLYFDHQAIRLFLSRQAPGDLCVMVGSAYDPNHPVALIDPFGTVNTANLGNTCQPLPDYRLPVTEDLDRLNVKGTWALSAWSPTQTTTLNCWCLEGDLPREGLFLEPSRQEVQAFSKATLKARMTLSGVPVGNVPISFEVRGLQGEIRLQTQDTTGHTGQVTLEYTDFVPSNQNVTATATVNGVVYNASAQVAWIQGVRCPIVDATQDTTDREATLTLTRNFRDRVLDRSARGRQYTRLYYQFSTEAAQIMMSHPMLLLRSREIIQRYKPVIQSIISGESVTLSRADLDEIDAFLNAFASKGSQEFRGAITGLRRDLRNPQVHSEFNITVSDGPRRDISRNGRFLQLGLLCTLFAACGVAVFGMTGRRRKAILAHRSPLSILTGACAAPDDQSDDDAQSRDIIPIRTRDPLDGGRRTNHV